MKAVIIEDELQPQQFLKTLIQRNYQDIEIVTCLDSIKSSVEFFNCNKVDLVFMDIQLKDGYCFSIFEKTSVDAFVVFTTAYDEYALKAFDHNAIAYLLKPLSKSKVESAIKKYYNITDRQYQADKIQQLMEMLKAQTQQGYAKRLLIRENRRMVFVEEPDIAYFIAKDRSVFLFTKGGQRYIVDLTLDNLYSMLNPQRFFRIARNAIVSNDSVVAIEKYFKGSLKVTLKPSYSDDVIKVSRDLTKPFLEWMQIG